MRMLFGWCLVAAVLGLPRAASAQDRLGGHFGAVFPLVTHVGGETTTISDDFVIGFPMGITVKTSDKWAFDLEFVPVIQNDPLGVSLTVHPGIIRALTDGWATGVRMAFDVNKASWGFTPLVNKSFPVPGHAYSWFIEGVVPIRFQTDPNDANGGNHGSIGLAAHIGIGF
ncbi:MAG TPA: hypothetical protein VKE51_39500 [Vicinamibacterales bacterium]|nr:hypothetical protein [Vicinamibacterales bacterium]